MKNKIELLSPAGSFSKLKAGLYFGADAVYGGGKQFSLRAMCDNFDNDELIKALDYTHKRHKKLYVTVNIFAREHDLRAAEDYFSFLSECGADAVIVSDIGLIAACRKVAPKLPIHVSTQANTLNKYTAAVYKDLGASRVILARELSLNEIKTINDYFQGEMELEAFVHGAMCISYSGRCLLSNYLSGRDSNRGACVQACRWNYEIRESNKKGDYLSVEEDDRGSYILNSKDLNMISHIDELASAGICSFKIEGRMKSEYYISSVVNAYRRAIDDYYSIGSEYKNNSLYETELKKTAHRAFTTAYMLSNNDKTVNYDNSQSQGDKTFIASVLSFDKGKGYALIEMRNRFFVGDSLEVLSPSESFNRLIKVERLEDEDGLPVSDAKLVMQKLRLYTSVELFSGDILRK